MFPPLNVSLSKPLRPQVTNGRSATAAWRAIWSSLTMAVSIGLPVGSGVPVWSGLRWRGWGGRTKVTGGERDLCTKKTQLPTTNLHMGSIFFRSKILEMVGET